MRRPLLPVIIATLSVGCAHPAREPAGKAFRHWPSAEKLTIHESRHAMLRSLDAARKLRRRFEDPSRTVLHIMPTPALLRAEGKQALYPSSMGEQIQANALYQLLRVILPEAKFERLPPDRLVPQVGLGALGTKRVYDGPAWTEIRDGVEYRHFVFDLWDFAELPHEVEMHRHSALDMGKMKPANLTVPEATRGDVRAALGLAPGARVVSVYGLYSQAPGSSELRELFPKDRQPDVVIRTDGGFPAESRPDELSMAALLDGELRLRPEACPCTIRNDLVGATLYAHLASDLVLVFGSVNPFEGLQAGVKTLFTSDFEGGKSGFIRSESWKPIAEAAQAQGAIGFRNQADLKRLLGSEEPWWLPQGKTAESARAEAVNALLEQVLERIELQEPTR